MKIFEIILEYIDKSKTLQNFGTKLEQRAKNDHSAENLSPEQILDKFIESDPTGEKGTYVLWMIRTYLNKGINYLEDLSRTGYALKLFHKFKQRLPVDKRDINRIKSLPYLEDLVEKFEEEKTSKEEKKEEKQEILSETEILYDGPYGKVMIPKTERASCFWGQGTKWCTAATRSENLFERYAREGDLYIMIFNNGKKAQLHFETEQLKNSEDLDIEPINFCDNSQYPNAPFLFSTCIAHYVKNKGFESIRKIFKFVFYFSMNNPEIFDKFMLGVKKTLNLGYEKYYLLMYRLFSEELSYMYNFKYNYDEVYKFINYYREKLGTEKIEDNPENLPVDLYLLIDIANENINQEILKKMSCEKILDVIDFAERTFGKNKKISHDAIGALFTYETEDLICKEKILKKCCEFINKNIDYIIKIEFSIYMSSVFSGLTFLQKFNDPFERKIIYENIKTPKIFKLIFNMTKNEEIKFAQELAYKLSEGSELERKLFVLETLLMTLNSNTTREVVEDFVVKNFSKNELLLLFKHVESLYNKFDFYQMSRAKSLKIGIETIKKILEKNNIEYTEKNQKYLNREDLLNALQYYSYSYMENGLQNFMYYNFDIGPEERRKFIEFLRSRELDILFKNRTNDSLRFLYNVLINYQKKWGTVEDENFNKVYEENLDKILKYPGKANEDVINSLKEAIQNHWEITNQTFARKLIDKIEKVYQT